MNKKCAYHINELHRWKKLGSLKLVVDEPMR